MEHGSRKAPTPPPRIDNRPPAPAGAAGAKTRANRFSLSR